MFDNNIDMEEKASEGRDLSDINGLSVIGNSTMQGMLGIAQVLSFTVVT